MKKVIIKEISWSEMIRLKLNTAQDVINYFELQNIPDLIITTCPNRYCRLEYEEKIQS